MHTWLVRRLTRACAVVLLRFGALTAASLNIIFDSLTALETRLDSATTTVVQVMKTIHETLEAKAAGSLKLELSLKQRGRRGLSCPLVEAASLAGSHLADGCWLSNRERNCN